MGSVTNPARPSHTPYPNPRPACFRPVAKPVTRPFSRVSEPSIPGIFSIPSQISNTILNAADDQHHAEITQLSSLPCCKPHVSSNTPRTCHQREQTPTTHRRTEQVLCAFDRRRHYPCDALSGPSSRIRMVARKFVLLRSCEISRFALSPIQKPTYDVEPSADSPACPLRATHPPRSPTALCGISHTTTMRLSTDRPRIWHQRK